MNLIPRLVRAVEKRESLWYPTRYARWEEIAEEVFADGYHDWLVKDRIEDRALYCKEEWENLRNQYLQFLQFLDERSIFTKLKKYRDGQVHMPVMLEFLAIPSNRLKRLEIMGEVNAPQTSEENGQIDEKTLREPYSYEDKLLMYDYFLKEYEAARPSGVDIDYIELFDFVVSGIIPAHFEKRVKADKNPSFGMVTRVKAIGETPAPAQGDQPQPAQRRGAKVKRRLFPLYCEP